MQEKTIINKPFYQRTWVVVLASLAALFLLLLVALPYGISYGLQQWLLANGSDDVQLQDIDFNVFTGRAAVTDLNVIASGQSRLVIPRLELDVDWLPLFSRHVAARTIVLDGVDIMIVQNPDGSLRIGGISLPAAAEDEVEETAEELWGVGLEQLEIINTTITYQSPDVQLVTHINNLTLDHLVTWSTDPAQLQLDGTVNDAPVVLDGQLPPLSDGFGFNGKLGVTSLQLHTFARLAEPDITGLGGQISIGSELDVLLTPGNSLTVSHTGVFGLDGLTLEQQGQHLSYGDLQWNGDVKLAAAIDDGGLDLELLGIIEGRDLGIADDDYQLSYGGQQWKGALNLNATGAGNTDIKLQGTITGNELAVVVPAEKMTLHNGSFLWEGGVAVKSGEDTAVAAEGRLQLGKLGADVAEDKVNLASIDGLAIEKLSVLENGDVTVTGMTISGAVFAKDTDETGARKEEGGSVLSAGQITADSVQVTAGNQVAIGRLEWRDVISLIQRDPDGVWRPVRIVSTLPFANTDTEEKQPAAAEAADAPAGRVRVDEISITGDSAMILDDRTVKPPFRMRLTVTEAILKNIDNGQPHQDSPVSIKGRISKHSHISVEGTTQPFAEQPTLDLKNHVDGISLPQLSAYTVDTLGYALESGHLDADSALKINKGEIDSQNKLVIRGLELTPVDNESREKLDGQLVVPLNSALSMLRDDNDTIELDLPVSGDIDSPDFDIGDIVNTAVSKAIKQGSMTYLKLALQPYGALITVAQLAGEAATKVRLQPVSFQPGLATPQGDTASYLQKVAGILKDRPGLNIKICGLAVAADQVALAGVVPGARETDSKTAGAVKDSKPVGKPQLLDLAKQRAGFVKDRLVVDYGVTASRLVACTPHIDDSEDDDIAPRVELLI